MRKKLHYVDLQLARYNHFVELFNPTPEEWQEFFNEIELARDECGEHLGVLENLETYKTGNNDYPF